ncbi:MAG: TIGR00282 family metallophosphoesterase [Planctomycetaceae bacterium]
MRILFLGDLVGRPGYAAVTKHLATIRQQLQIDFVIVNAENAADGSGLTCRQFKGLVDAGVDAITMGDHIYKKIELKPLLEHDPRIVKPANYPSQSPGRPWTVLRSTAAGLKQPAVPVAVVSLLGRVYMRPVDCPFAAADRVLAEMPADVKVRIVDMHAEATSDKQLMGYHLAGRVTAVLGTHTHVPTADAKLLAGGTAYQTDVGMTGPYESVIGRDVERVMLTTTTFEPCHFHVATGDVRICGAVIDVDVATGQATSITRFEYPVSSTSDTQPSSPLCRET